MKTLNVLALSLSAALLLLGSCQKDNKENSLQPTTELSTTVQLSVADDQVNEGIATAMDAADGVEDGSADLRPLACAVIDVNASLKTISIDFGSGCVNPVTGKTRSGKIIVGYTGDSFVSATERTISFENFKTVDTVVMNGTFTQSNIVHENNKVSFSLTASDFTFLLSGGKTHTLLEYNRNFIVDLGSNIRDISDNTTTISGKTTGINEEGEPYSVNITNPVIFNGECSASQIYYPVTGAFDIKIGNKPKFNVSWGTGTCDKLVTITYLGTTVDVALK